MTDLPLWLREQQSYTPKKGNSRFATRSGKAVLSIMAKFHISSSIKAKRSNTSLRLFGLLLMLVLTAVSHNYLFVLIMMAVSAVATAFLNSKQIKALVSVVLPAAMLALLILLPSVFLNNPKTPATIIGKILVCTSLVMCFNLTTPFDHITRALKGFFVPNVVIFTLDLAIKYIFILGNICSQMLTALKVRTIGANHNQRSTASGILGTVLIKARQASVDTSRAMECRGFDGKYPKRREQKLVVADYLYILFLVAVIGAFVYLEVIV